jgi:predicted Zn-dependent protease
MAVPWLKHIRNSGQLKVYNKASSWSGSVESAIRSFNKLSFGVTLVAVAEEKKANVVLVLATGPTQYSYYGATAKTDSDFKAERLHGQASSFNDPDKNERLFSAIFLPGKIGKATEKQKEVVVVHEFIHACGMDGHDTAGIMFSAMTEEDGGLIEAIKTEGAKPMPPIRVGSKTLSTMQKLWPGGGTPKPK